jgi:hypothetical protein
MTLKPYSTRKHPVRAKLIFNPSAGATRDPHVEIVDVIHELQAWKFVPEAYLVEADCDLPGIVQKALAQGDTHVRGYYANVVVGNKSLHNKKMSHQPSQRS